MIMNNWRMDLRRLQLLLELSRLGSMTEVAEELRTTTSNVSQQIAVLAREAGAALIEPHGRRVRLTPAGRRLAEHAATILAAVEAARLDLDPEAEPVGTVRVAGFATVVRRSLLPTVANLAVTHPRVQLRIHEHETAEALAMLAADDVDLALTYDYNLAPASVDYTIDTRPLWSTTWSLGVPHTEPTADGDAPAVFERYRRHNWIANSRNPADEHVIRTISSIAGFEPRVVHFADSLNLLQDLIVAGLGIGLLPADQPTRPGVRLLSLANPEVLLRSYALTRRGRASWPALRLILDLLTAHAKAEQAG